MALAKKTSVMREVMLSLLEPANKDKFVPRRACGHFTTTSAGLFAAVCFERNITTKHNTYKHKQ